MQRGPFRPALQPEESMRRVESAPVGACLALAASLTATSALAQPAQIMPILDHIHLNVPDQAKGVEWYQKYFGGQPITEAPDRLMFGDTSSSSSRTTKGSRARAVRSIISGSQSPISMQR